MTPPPRWTITSTSDAVTFSWAADSTEGTSRPGPRAWNKRGFALSETDLPSFTDALAEVMKLPRYWSARAADPDRSAGEASLWSEPHYDSDEDFVYVAGPCVLADDLQGYHPATTFTIALVHVRGLRIRIAAYLRNRVSAHS